MRAIHGFVFHHIFFIHFRISYTVYLLFWLQGYSCIFSMATTTVWRAANQTKHQKQSLFYQSYQTLEKRLKSIRQLNEQFYQLNWLITGLANLSAEWESAIFEDIFNYFLLRKREWTESNTFSFVK